MNVNRLHAITSCYHLKKSKNFTSLRKELVCVLMSRPKERKHKVEYRLNLIEVKISYKQIHIPEKLDL